MSLKNKLSSKHTSFEDLLQDEEFRHALKRVVESWVIAEDRDEKLKENREAIDYKKNQKWPFALDELDFRETDFDPRNNQTHSILMAIMLTQAETRLQIQSLMHSVVESAYPSNLQMESMHLESLHLEEPVLADEIQNIFDRQFEFFRNFKSHSN